MATLQQKVVKAFLADLAKTNSLDEGKIEALRKLLAENPKVKVDDFVKIFTADSGDVP